MTRPVTFDTPPPGTGPWRCTKCERATVTSYRCANYDCGADLAGASLGLIP